MEILDPSTIAFLLIAGFIAAFIDSTVGGGGLISTPALLALGLPVNFALGTNKLAASMGGLMSVFSFWKAGKINQKVALTLMPLSFIGSALGAYVVYLLPEQLMKNVIVVLLVAVAVYTYRRKDWGDVSAVKQLGLAALAGSVAMAFGIGFYDGFFGPGTGSFLIFGFLFLGYDFVTAAGNAKALNLRQWYRGAAVLYFKRFRTLDLWSFDGRRDGSRVPISVPEWRSSTVLLMSSRCIWS